MMPGIYTCPACGAVQTTDFDEETEPSCSQCAFVTNDQEDEDEQ